MSTQVFSQSTPQIWGEVEGQSISFPMQVDDLNQLTMTYTVDLEATAGLIPEGDFSVLETAPGKATAILAIVDYIKNPWGDYGEYNLGLLAIHTPSSEVGSFVWRMPVNQRFTMLAARASMGFPKTVELIDFEYGHSEISSVLKMTDEPSDHTIRVTWPAVAPSGDATAVDAASFAYLDGSCMAIDLSMQMPTGAIDPSQVSVELGQGAAANELRSLGLDQLQPDFAAWQKGLSAVFNFPRKL